ncbi:unnamed protein product [Caenorhabditis brenneri]
MADNRFPLFRIPFLALSKIVDFYGPHDIIQLSLCSKRSLRVAKKCWKKKGLVTANLDVKAIPKINLHFDDTPFYHRFIILQAIDLQDEETHNIRIGDAVVPSIHKDTETVTYWQDTIHGIGQIIGYIRDLFDVPITTIYLTVEENQNEILNTMDSILSRQESVQDCILRSENSIDDCLTHLLDNCEITGDLIIVGRLSTKFRHNWNVSLNGLHVSKVLSFTFQNLTNIDCQALDLYSSSLTSKDLNQFLKHWQNGGSPRIRFASIMINSMDHDIVTSGIETVPLPQGMSRSYPHMRNSKMMISVGLDIKRNDGKIGTIHLFENSFGFGVDPIEVFNY